jgi:hypothetical protein
MAAIPRGEKRRLFGDRDVTTDNSLRNCRTGRSIAAALVVARILSGTMPGGEHGNKLIEAIKGR